MQLMKPKQLQKNKTSYPEGSPLQHSVRKWAYSTNPEHCNGTRSQLLSGQERGPFV